MVDHNELNGVAFSTAEFLIVTIAAAAVAIASGIQHHLIGTLLAAGIALNSLVIVSAGALAWSRGERGTPLAQLFSPKHREALIRQHPSLMGDTVIVAGAVLVPFGLLTCAAVDLVRRSLPRA